jgi:tetratricopeptide (TPR) repeat protein
MQASDLIASFALLVSLGVAFWTVWQKISDNAGTARKSFNEIIVELSNTAVRFEEIIAFDKDRQLTNLRRVLNSRRRFLVVQAESILPHLAGGISDIENQLLAIAWDSSGDHVKARHYWEKCVDASPTPQIRAFNLRGLARYLYRIGMPDLGRERYRESSILEVSWTKETYNHKIDTYLMWARTEIDHGYIEEAKRIFALAVADTDRVSFAPARREFHHRLASEFPEFSTPLDAELQLPQR